MTTVRLIVLCLELINKWVDWAKAQGYIAEGEAREIARSAAAISAKVEVKNEITAEVNKLPDAALDDELQNLGRTVPRKPDPRG